MMAGPKTPGSDEYELGERLGRGLTSEVYLGWYGPARVAVLLKRFRPHDPDRLRLNRLRWQVLWAGAKRYPGLAWMRGVQEDEDGQRTLILERAGDESVEQFLRRNEQGMEAGAAVLFVRKLTETLQQAAELGLDYQFLQPATLMIEGGTDPVVLGFDLAGQYDLAALAADADPQQIAFLAPEQRTGDGSDERSLVYSLGVLLAVLMAPEWLFGQEETAEPAPVPLAELEKRATPETTTLLQTALQADPALRYQDLEGFLEAAYAAEVSEIPDGEGALPVIAPGAAVQGWKPSGVPKGATAVATPDQPETYGSPSPGADPLPGPRSAPDDGYRSGRPPRRLGVALLYLLLAAAAAGALLLVLEPGILEQLRQGRVAADGPLPPTPTVFNLGISSTITPTETTRAPEAATARPAATSTPTDVPATATATATRPSPTPTRVTATPSPSPSPSATVIVPSPTIVVILPTFTPVPPPTEPPPPPPTEPPPPPPTEPPPPTPTAPSP